MVQYNGGGDNSTLRGKRGGMEEKPIKLDTRYDEK
jgi:hypothetical protein